MEKAKREHGAQWEVRHPLYIKNQLMWKKAFDIYEGGKRIEDGPYLIQHPHENKTQFDIRKQRATYRNFAAPVVDVFTSMINEGRPSRTLPAQLEAMLENVDRTGVNADAFFDDVTRMAAAVGSHFVLVDMEKQQGITVYEDTSVGRRTVPYFVSIPSFEVWDWSLDEKGLVWAVVHGRGTSPHEPFSDRGEYETLTIWTRAEWIRFKRDVSVSGDGNSESLDFHMEDRGTHNIGFVPLVPFLFEKETEMTGIPATDDVMSLILKVYRRDSELDKMLFDRAVPLLMVQGLDGEAWNKFTLASNNALFSEATGDLDARYVEPSGIAFQSLKDAINDDINSIREISLRMVRPQSGVGMSAESKEIDRQQLDCQLAKFARMCAYAEALCWKYAARWLGISDEGIETPYNTDYDIERGKIDRQLITEMYRSGALSVGTYLEMMKKAGSLPEDFDVEAESEKKSRELVNSGGAASGNSLKTALGL